LLAISEGLMLMPTSLSRTISSACRLTVGARPLYRAFSLGLGDAFPLAVLVSNGWLPGIDRTRRLPPSPQAERRS
jgi:hypothetical protein